MGGRLMVLLVCLAGTAQAAPPTDLLPALARAETCAEGSDACTPSRKATAGSEPTVVRLAPGTRRHLYLHLPATAVLRLALAGGGLAVAVQSDDVPERELHRSRGDEETTIDLSPVAGRVVRLTFASPPDGAATEVRRALLDVPTPPPTGASLTDGAPPLPPNVVVYVIDTLRADHLGCYGWSRPTSPRIDQFARSAVRFSHAAAQSSWTLPSIASILTGRTPPEHGAIGPDRGIRPEVPTLAALLQSRGYTTAAFVTNYLGSGVFGLDRGFATYRFYPERGDHRASVYLGSDALVRRVLRWLARAPREPFFLYVHASDPHFPYLPPRRYAREFVAPADARRLPALVESVRPLHNGRDAWGTRPVRVAPADIATLRDAYDGDVRMADAAFGRLLDALAARGLAERTLVVLTSDHGEEFLEHRGVAHGQTLYVESVHVPLLLHLPGGRGGGRTLDTLAQHVDIVPTVLDVAGVPAPSGLAGVSLVRGAALPVEAHTSLRLGRFALDGLVGERWKVVQDHRDDGFEVYATDRDPGERVDRATSTPVLLGYARPRLEALAVRGAAGPAVSEERLGRLRALGYVTE